MSSLLKKSFTDKHNFAYLLDAVQQELYKTDYKGRLNEINDEFIEVVNVIASAVFNHEHVNNSKKSLEDGLYTINNIIIKEAVNYIISKFPEKKEENVIPDKIVMKTNEENFKVFVEDKELSFSNSPIPNVTKITVEGLYCYNQEYIVNETNDEISFTEGIDNNTTEIIYIKLEHANYTKEALVMEIQELLRENSIVKNLYTCFLDVYSEKIIISSSKICDNQKNNTPFSKRQVKNNLLVIEKNKKLSNNYTEGIFNLINTKNSILKTLGFKNIENLQGKYFYEGENPIKLIKPNKMNMNLSIYMDNSEFPEIYKEKIFLNQSNSENVFYKLNYQKSFPEAVNIKKFMLNFENYNHRGFPYSLIVNVHQQILS